MKYFSRRFREILKHIFFFSTIQTVYLDPTKSQIRVRNPAKRSGYCSICWHLGTMQTVFYLRFFDVLRRNYSARDPALRPRVNNRLSIGFNGHNIAIPPTIHSIVFRLDGNSDHILHTQKGKCIFLENKISSRESRSNQKPITGKIS